ncbi:AfsR/SARP family transcriptional regulator [Actinocorallia aurantiaca]|uniref:BTAD domain-containing putative transcriptional regulator n=1 Tax=Actinocorallia aurantiaca TaxID=46204 RepID=A0ABN3UNR7_9ACTN
MDAVKVFGPLTVTWQGEPCDLGGAREQSVLAVLLLECGRPVAAESIIARVWDQEAPDIVRGTLTSYISRFRGRFKRPSGQVMEITSQNGTYTLHADTERIDLHRFRRLRRQALAIGESGDTAQAAALLREADEQVQGDPLAGLPGRWMQQMRTSLSEEVRAAGLERIALELRRGRHAEVVSELYRLLAQHPEDEGLARHLMIALYRCGRQADALRVYQETRMLLKHRYGSEPGEGLRETHQRILRQDLGLAVTPLYRRESSSQPSTLLPRPENLTGRSGELNMLLRRSGESAGDERPGPVVDVIEGMAGVGKTALAVHAAHAMTRQYPDAQLFLDLRGHDPEQRPLTAASALSELLRMLDLPPPRIPHDVTERKHLWQRELADRRVVIVLDDATSLDQIVPLLPSAPGCRVLVTTRRRLRGLSGAVRLPLDVLTPDEATALLTKTAGRKGMAADPKAREIVRRLGHLPLAIRLAASNLRDRYAGDTGAFVADLIAGESGAAGREPADAAVIAAFELSYRQLDANGQRLLRSLAFTPCPRITVRAAAALVGRPPDEVGGHLEMLVDHHLLSAGDQGGYVLHDLTRAFARARSLREDTTASRRRDIHRLVIFYLETTGAADHVLHPYRRRLTVAPAERTVQSRSEAQAFMQAEWPNILAVARYAIRHEWKRAGADLIIAASKFLENSGLWEECASADLAALQAFRSLGDRKGTGQALLELGFVTYRTGHHQQALQYAHRAASHFRALGDSAAEAEAIDWAGVVHWSMGKARAALAYHQEARGIYRRTGNLSGEAQALGHAGIAFWQLGRYREAIEHLSEALAAFQQVGDQRNEAMTLNNLGEVLRQRGLHRDAMELYQKSMKIFAEITGRQYDAIIRNNLGSIHYYKGDYPTALDHFRQALTTFWATGDRRNIASALNSIGAAYQEMEKHSEALIHHYRARQMAESIEESYELIRALAGTARAQSGLGDHERALASYESALVLAQTTSDPYQQGMIHDGIGSAFHHLNDPDTARIHWRQALNLLQELSVPEAETIAIRLEAMEDDTTPGGPG